MGVKFLHVIAAAKLELTNTSGGVMLNLESASGDSVIRFTDNGSHVWDIGRDNTQQNLVFSSDAGLGATDAFVLTESGNATFAGNVTGDFIGDLTGTADNASDAQNAANVTVADESSDTTCFPLFVTAATGNQAAKSGTNLTFNSEEGVLTATSFVGALTGNVTGNVSGTAATVTTAAQGDITSLGTLTALTVSGVLDLIGTTDSTDATGDTGILKCEGGASIAKKIYAGGTITGSVDVVAYSDEKLKENIKTLDGKKVLEMRGVSFDRIDTGKASSGVIAQEMEKVAPELVIDDGNYKGVAYGNLVGYLIEAVKDQQKQIDELKKICNGDS
tara:strand:- start:632 stop:1627 length:996 start_codon:yes stop_codon:yes gene_type:complete